jgi:proton-coupled amino acid transporter
MTSGGGEEVPILQNLDPHLTVSAVKLAMSANLTFMTPITMLPASKAVEDALRLSDMRSRSRVNAARLALICSCAVVATLLPDFEVSPPLPPTSRSP